MPCIIASKQAKETKRKYVYSETEKEVMEWAKKEEIIAPNNKENFPFYLEQYLNHLKFEKKKR